MFNIVWDHVHLRTPDAEATAQWFERMLGADILRSTQQGAPRIDLKLGGVMIFLAPVTAGDGVNPPPVTPCQGLDHIGFQVTDLDDVAASPRPRAPSSRWSRMCRGLASRSVSFAGRRVFRSNCSSATPNTSDRG